MKKIIFISLKYSKSDAITNRLVAFVNGVNELGINADILFLLPSEEVFSHNLDSNKTSIVNLWETGSRWTISNKYVLFIFSIISLRKKLKKDENIVLMNFILPLFIFLSFFKGINLYHERTESPEIFFKNTFFDRLAEKIYIYYCKKSQGIFIISNKIRSYFLNKGVDEKKFQILNMIVDTKRFENFEIKTFPYEYIAYCGTISNEKDGVDYLIKAFKIVSVKYPNLKLLIAGNTPIEEERIINLNLVNKLLLKEKVEFLGKMDFSDIPSFLFNAKILALARPKNQQSDGGFPTKLGEYLCTGVPTVITDVGEINNYLTHNINCVFSRPNNEEDFAEKMIWVLENYPNAVEISQRGKKIAFLNFNYKNQAQILINRIYG